MDASKTGKLIRELRTEKGLTQQELASLLGVSPTAVSKWENGRGLPDISMLEPLVKVLQVTFAEIILGERAAHEAAGTEAVMNKTEEPAKAAGAPADDKTEAAIKSVIDESIIQKEQSARKSIIVVAAVMLVLAAAFIVVSVTGLGSSKHRSTLDLTGLEIISSLPMDGAFVQGGKQYLPYRYFYGSGLETFMKELNITSPDQIGKVVAYRFTTNDSACYYYCTVEAMPGDWLLMFEDDRSGVPGEKNVMELFGTQESIDRVSDWLPRGNLNSFHLTWDESSYNIDKSVNRYTAVYDWEAKPAEHLYAYTAEMSVEVRASLIELLNGPEKIGALLPVHTPENALQFDQANHTQILFCLIDRKQMGIITAAIAEVGAKTGALRKVSGDYEGVDWAGIAGYTSQEAPMHLYFEGYQLYAVIGDTAYCLTKKNIPSLEKIDSFVPYSGGTVKDVMQEWQK